MRLLVTGASGFIGRNFLIASDPSWRIDAVYRSASDFTAFLVDTGLWHVSAHRCDLSDAAQVGDLTEALPEHFDVILYLAANSDPAASSVDPIADSMSGPVALVTLLSAVRCDRLLYFSSGAIYEGLHGEVGPQMPVAPSLPYAISKLACEGYVRWFRDIGRVGEYVILRFFAAFGPHEAPRRICTRLVRWAFGGAVEPFKIRGDGRNLVDSMYVGDAVRGINKVIASDISNEVVDFATGTPLTVNELVERAACVLDVQSPAIRHTGEVLEYQEFVASSRKMKQLFDFTPEVPLEEGLLELRKHLAAIEAIR